MAVARMSIARRDSFHETSTVRSRIVCVKLKKPILTISEVLGIEPRASHMPGKH